MSQETNSLASGSHGTGSASITPRWPLRLKEISGELRHSSPDTSLDTARGEAWKILYLALSMYIRRHSAAFGRIPREDVEDLAAEKALELLGRVVSGVTDLSGPTPGEIGSFLSKVARNQLLDLLRRQGRRIEPVDDDNLERLDRSRRCEGLTMGGTDGPDARVERREFAQALRKCAEHLDARSRLIWLFRVFYSMATRDIAIHPKIRIKAGHVDVLLQRARLAIRDCMRRKDFDLREIPPGTFAELWRAFRPERTSIEGA
jgi:RNA polymerase sigma factor (sigma-70 family)